MMAPRRRDGFSLTEILVVLAIIGVIVVIVLSSTRGEMRLFGGMRGSMEVMAGLRGGLDFLSRDISSAVLVHKGTFSGYDDGRNSVLVFERFRSGQGLLRVGYQVAEEGQLLRYEGKDLDPSVPRTWRGGVPVLSQVKRLRFAFLSSQDPDHPVFQWDGSSQALPRGVGIILTVADSHNPEIEGSLETIISLSNAA